MTGLLQHRQVSVFDYLRPKPTRIVSIPNSTEENDGV